MEWVAFPSPGIFPTQGWNPHFHAFCTRASFAVLLFTLSGKRPGWRRWPLSPRSQAWGHAFNYFQILPVQIKRNGGGRQLAEAEAGCRLGPGPHGGWRVELCQGSLASLVRQTSASGGWLCFPCGHAQSFPSSARFKVGFHKQSPGIHSASANPNQTRRFCQI